MKRNGTHNCLVSRMALVMNGESFFSIGIEGSGETDLNNLPGKKGVFAQLKICVVEMENLS